VNDLHDHGDHGDLIDRLARLGDALDLDDTGIDEHVLAGIRAERAPRRRAGWLVAAVLVVTLAGVVVSPTSRRAVARWFGLDGLTVEIDPDTSVPPPSATFDTPGPGETVEVEVQGRRIVVSAVDGELTEQLILKTVGSSDQIREVTVDGHTGLWFAGVPHHVMYDAAVGDVVVERVAGNTLVWQDGDTLRRVEGFARLSDAIDFVEGT